MPAAAFYVSGHGFGHASRQIEIINALGRLTPGLDIVVRTSASRALFDRTLDVPVTFLPGACDTGLVQIDSVRLDAAASVRRAAEFQRRSPSLAREEAAVLRAHDVALVLSDAPPLACEAAEAAGVPSVVVGNFTWDWIYAGYDREIAAVPDLVPSIRQAYAHARAGWRLPMHGGFATVPSIVDVPFVARHATHEAADARRQLRLPGDRHLALLSFGGYGLGDFDARSLDCLDEWDVVITRDGSGPTIAGVHAVDERELYARGLRYEDLVRAVDVVVTKPGYGIISECVANGPALLYTSRGRFAEYDVLVERMPRVLRCGFIDQPSLLAGRWRAFLDGVLAAPPPPERPATNGAAVVAGLIRALLEDGVRS